MIAFLLVLALVGYLAVLFWYKTGLSKLSSNSANPASASGISVIIAARNEELTLPACLNSILKADSTNEILEIIVVDDNSTDNTAGVVREFSQADSRIKLLSPADYAEFSHIKSPKKRAVQAGFGHTSGDWIALTDADCIVSETWISAFTDAIRPDLNLIAGPVEFKHRNSWFYRWQHLEFAGLMLVSAGAIGHQKPATANGANLWVRKSAFLNVDAFSGVSHIISGDDELLMHKIHRKFPGSVGYVFRKEATVLTDPPKNAVEFFNQRKRWASKGLKYQSVPYRLYLFAFVLVHLLFLLSPVFALLNWISWFFALGILFLKFIGDSWFLNSANRFLSVPVNPAFSFLFGWIQIPYVVVTALLGTFSGFEWKGKYYR